MKTSIQKFQIVFLLVLYAVAFAFFHMFPENTNASGPRSHQPASASATNTN